MKNRFLKSHKVGRISMLAFSMLVLAAVLTQTSFARQLGQILGPDPDAGAPPFGQAADRLQGLQPDDNGYQGELPMPAAPALIAGDDPDAAAPQGGPVFKVEANARDISSEAVKGFSFPYWIFAAGSSLHSADFTMRQDYQPGGCVSVIDSGIQFLTLNLDLPDGSLIEYLRVFYYDNSASDGTANLRKYDAMGGVTEIATVNSNGASPAYGTNLSAYIGHVVDNLNGGYVLNWLPVVASPEMQLCGLRVAYRLPN